MSIIVTEQSVEVYIMNFTAYVDRQRRAIRAAHFKEEAVACNDEVDAVGVIEDRDAARYFERLSAKLFEELDSMRGFRREERKVCC